MELGSTLLLVIFLIELGAFLVIDFLFSRKDSASKLTDTKISQKNLKIINTIQILLILLTIMFTIDTYSSIITLNHKKNSIDTSHVTGQIQRS